MQNERKRHLNVIGLSLLLITGACKKEAVPTPADRENETNVEIEAIRVAIADRHNLSLNDVGYDKKHKYFSILLINTISFEDALIEYKKDKP